MFELKKLVRENILNLKPYSSARDEYSGEEGIFLDANENSLGSTVVEIVNRYPDPYQKKLKAKISIVKGISTENVDPLLYSLMKLILPFISSRG